MRFELYHSGVKGMKWGVRKDKSIANEPVTKIHKRGGTTTITSKSKDQKAKLTVKRDRGAKLVAKSKDTKIKVVVSNTATIASGALWVASAFVPGLPILNTVAAAANLVGIATAQK